MNARLPDVWPARAPKPVWRIAVGDGYSSPVVAAGFVYIMGREAGDQETCLCLDAETGRQSWKHAYAAPYEPHPAARGAGKGPKSTPTVDDDRVYMLGINGLLHCFDAKTGRIKWKRDFNSEFWGHKGEDGYDAWATYCGASASPLIDGDRLIFPVGGPKAGAMTAFNKHTGAIVWKVSQSGAPDTPLPDRSSYASPVTAELAGIRQIVGFTGTRMAGLDARSGELLWEYPFKIGYEQTIVTPVVWKDLVIVCGEGKPVAALRIEKRGGKPAMSVAWQNKELQSYMASPVVHRDHLYGLDEGGELVCVDLASGATAWAKGRFGQYVSMVVAGDQLLVLTDEGELHVLAATAKAFTPKARLRLTEAGGTWAYLAVCGNRIYVKDKEHLICFGF